MNITNDMIETLEAKGLDTTNLTMKEIEGRYKIIMEERQCDFVSWEDTKDGKKPKVKSIGKIINLIKQNIDIITPSHITTKRESSMLHYKDGIYTNTNTESIVYKRIKKGYGEALTVQKINETLSILGKETLYNINDFDSDKNILNCNDGLLNLETKEFSDHTSNYKSLTKLPIDYNPEATCPTIHKFLGEVVGEDYINLMYEIAGFCLLNDMPLEKMFLLIGSGSNGKSVYLQLLKALMGKNTQSKSITQLDKDPYAMAYLKDVMVNICGDISDKKIDNSSIFKALTSREEVDAQVKYGSNISFKPTCKLIFSANKPPATDDYSVGFWRRWVLVKFPNNFDNDQKLISRLTTKEELEGFLIQALNGLDRVLKNGFSQSLDVNETMEVYQNERNSFYDWVNDNVNFTQGSITPLDSLYADYLQYCNDNKIIIIDVKNVFSRRLLGYIKNNDIDASNHRPRINNEIVNMYQNVSLNFGIGE